MDLKTLNESVLREVHLMPKGGHYSSIVVRNQAIQQAGCKQRILANPIIRGIKTVNYIYNPLWKILLQQAAIWHLQYPRGFPTANE